MRIVPYIKCFLYSSKYFFRFRKPIINQLEFIDIVFKGKGYFLISWDVSNAYLVSLTPLQIFAFSKKKSIVVKLSDNVTEIELIVRNTWRKYHKTIKIKRIELNAQTDFDIITQFESIKTNRFHSKKLMTNYSNPIMQLNSIAIKKTKIGIRRREVNITSGSLSYHRT